MSVFKTSALHELLCTFARFAQLFENVVHFSDSYRAVWIFKKKSEKKHAIVLDVQRNCKVSKAWASYPEFFSGIKFRKMVQNRLSK